MNLSAKQYFQITMLFIIAQSVLIIALFWQTSYLQKEIKALRPIGIGDNVSCSPAADEGCETIKGLKEQP